MGIGLIMYLRIMIDDGYRNDNWLVFLLVPYSRNIPFV